MAKVQAFSSVSVVDLTDVGTINLYCTSSQPLSVIYDPNSSSYTPNWANSNSHLVITPVISYNGVNVPLTVNGQGNSALVISFTRKVGNAAATALGQGETVTNGILVVSENQLSTITQITYVCHVTYSVPNASISVEAETSITYTKVSQATNIKDISIKGETAFLYSSDRTTVVPSTITLSSYVSGGVSITKWQYQTYTEGTNGERNYYFADYPTGTNYNQTNPTAGGTWIVKPDESGIWIDNKYAVIKALTEDSSVYDTIQINKINDGAAGDAIISAVLTNDNFIVPVDAQGTVISQSVWSAGATTVRIYEGGEEAVGWTVPANQVVMVNVQGTYNQNTHTFTPTALTADAGYVEFVCVKTGYNNIVKRFTMTKQYAGTNGQPGADAVVYTVEPNTYIINWRRNSNNTFDPMPSSVTFNAYSKTGNSDRAAYIGRFRIYVKIGTGNYVAEPVYETQNQPESSCTFNLNNYSGDATSITGIKCCLSSSSTWTVLDQQTVAITSDGTNGASGSDGEDGITMQLGNYNDIIPCTEAGVAVTGVTAAKIITIPYYAYKGITQIAPTAQVVGPLPSGVTSVVTPATVSNNVVTANGYITLTVANGARFCGENQDPLSFLTGDIIITLQAEGVTTYQTYTWTKNIKATDGQNGKDAVLLQIYSRDGGVLVNSEGRTTLESLLTSGGTVVASEVTYEWAKYGKNNNNVYDYYAIQNATTSSLIVTPAMVDDIAFFRLKATYNSHDYYAYYTVDDITDPYTAYTFATIEQFKNTQGVGAIYTRVYQNGVEIDPIKSTVFSTEAPTASSAGEYYYLMNPTTGTCTLKKSVADGGSYTWTDISSADEDTLTYTYSALDSSGNAVTTGRLSHITARCFCIRAADINGRMQFICEVTD